MGVVPASQLRLFPRLVQDGYAVYFESALPAGLAGWALVCRSPADARSLTRLQEVVRRGASDRHYAGIIAGMVLLLALCGWVVGGDEAAHWLVEEAVRPGGGAAPTPQLMRQRFGARPIVPTEWPALFAVLADLCHRAGLARLPDLYCIPGPGMNAYALGGPARSAISVTEGLIRSLTLDEIAGILAHEIAHISRDDTAAVALAAALHRAIAFAAPLGLICLSRRGACRSPPLEALLGNASTIAQLLLLALSRLQETDADGLAAEWIGDPRMLVAALDKLERHHGGFPALPMAMPEPGVDRYLRSHPATGERVGRLLALAG